MKRQSYNTQGVYPIKYPTRCFNHVGISKAWVACFVKGCLVRGKHMHCEDRHGCVGITKGVK